MEEHYERRVGTVALVSSIKDLEHKVSRMEEQNARDYGEAKRRADLNAENIQKSREDIQELLDLVTRLNGAWFFIKVAFVCVGPVVVTITWILEHITW